MMEARTKGPVRATEHREHMFELAKYILTKVSFDLQLFEKEYRKFVKQLKDEERQLLVRWCMNNFSTKHQMVIRETTPPPSELKV